MATEEVTHGHPQEDGDAEQTTPPQQADAGEQVEATVWDTQSQVGADDTQQHPNLEVYAHEGSLKREKLC